MKPSEELMLLLELNGYDITKFKLKKQLEYDKTGNIDLYRHKKYADLITSHYLFTEEKDHFHRNPLLYRLSWGEDIQSIDQFYFKHPELDYELTIKEFAKLKSYNEVQKEAILYDVLDQWVEEYREATIVQMEHLREMIKLLPKKSKKYKKPSKVPMLFMVFLLLLIAFIYRTPEVLKPSFLTLTHDFVDGYVNTLYNVPWYSFLGIVAVFFTGLYVVANNALTRYIRDVRSEKNKRTDWMFNKWEKDLEKTRLNQSGQLEDYVDRVIKDNTKTELAITSMIGPEILLDKFKSYVTAVDHRYDWMTKYYRTMMKWLTRTFLIALLFNIIFYVLGFAIIGGWINV